MDSLPLELVSFLQSLRPLFRAEVFVHFGYLMAGILIGEAKYGTVRASVFANAGSGRSACQICSAATSSRIRDSWQR